MKVVFHTNIDAYNERIRPFPEHISEVPRKGDMIRVKPDFESYFRNLKLPTRLEVVNIEWKEEESGSVISNNTRYTDYETIVYCELWYNKLDKELADFAGAKTL